MEFPISLFLFFSLLVLLFILFLRLTFFLQGMKWWEIVDMSCWKEENLGKSSNIAHLVSYFNRIGCVISTHILSFTKVILTRFCFVLFFLFFSFLFLFFFSFSFFFFFFFFFFFLVILFLFLGRITCKSDGFMVQSRM